MPDKAVHLLVFPGFADWEAAHAIAELRRHGGYRIEVVGFDGEPVESMGGVRVMPSRVLADVDVENVAIFILPGGDRWEKRGPEPELVNLLERLDARGTPVAAICAATTAIVRAGVLRGRHHTSNGLAYLSRQVAEYSDASTYVDAPAVRDRGLITASGLSDVEFAHEIMAELGVLSEVDRAHWRRLFRDGRIPPKSA